MSQASDKKHVKPPMRLDPMTSQTKHASVGRYIDWLKVSKEFE